MRDASVICFLMVFLFGPRLTVAAAQDIPATLLAPPTPQVRPGQTIWVTTSDGRELSGSVLSVSASALEMTGPGGELSMPLSDVRTIEARDSLKNGARNGAMIGGVSLGIYLGLLSQGLKCERDCGADYSATRDTIGAVAFGIGVGAGAGALSGLLADHLVKGRRVVYAVASTKSTLWEIWPAIAKRGLRVHATVCW